LTGIVLKKIYRTSSLYSDVSNVISYRSPKAIKKGMEINASPILSLLLMRMVRMPLPLLLKGRASLMKPHTEPSKSAIDFINLAKFSLRVPLSPGI